MIEKLNSSGPFSLSFIFSYFGFHTHPPFIRWMFYSFLQIFLMFIDIVFYLHSQMQCFYAFFPHKRLVIVFAHIFSIPLNIKSYALVDFCYFLFIIKNLNIRCSVIILWSSFPIFFSSFFFFCSFPINKHLKCECMKNHDLFSMFPMWIGLWIHFPAIFKCHVLIQYSKCALAKNFTWKLVIFSVMWQW